MEDIQASATVSLIIVSLIIFLLPLISLLLIGLIFPIDRGKNLLAIMALPL